LERGRERDIDRYREREREREREKRESGEIWTMNTVHSGKLSDMYLYL
jgi:hypothetical protein